MIAAEGFFRQLRRAGKPIVRNLTVRRGVQLLAPVMRFGLYSASTPSEEQESGNQQEAASAQNF
jgi:hypothetical protein